MSDQELWDSIRTGDVKWIANQLQRMNHWPDKSRTMSCSDGTCGDVENCEMCGQPRKKPDLSYETYEGDIR